MLHKRVVRPTHLSPTSYVSPIVSTEKKDGSTRLILNLKRFNECIQFNTVSDIGGRWSESESPAHINIFELLAAKLVLQSFGEGLVLLSYKAYA